MERGLASLVDSGAQYTDGTTDVTRTIAIGRPDEPDARSLHPGAEGPPGASPRRSSQRHHRAQLDALARVPLWAAGLDFDHGIGHGVGSYLCVHEGPHRIAKTGTIALLPGMIVSNEPGYYKAGGFGIRIENLVVIEPRPVPGGEREMLGFETLTLAPIDLRLVERKLMDDDEIKWLDAYHARVRKVLSPLVDASTRRWLAEVTRRLEAARIKR